jgi:hypothetical protein
MATTKPIRSVSKTITPMGSNLILLDDGISMGKATLSDGVSAVASGLIDTAIDGLDLGTASQSDAADFATASQGSKADSAVQPDDIGTMATETAADYTKTSDLAAVATSNDYGDLSNLPTLGTGAALDAPSDPDLSNDTDKLALRGDVDANLVLQYAADDTALKALDIATRKSAFNLANEGWWLPTSDDISAEITAGDPRYRPTAGDATGASGGWYQAGSVQTGNFYADDGARIIALADRIMVGDASPYNGKAIGPDAKGSWLFETGALTGGYGWMEAGATFGSVSSRGVAVLGAARNDDGLISIGGNFVAFNNGTDSSKRAWGAYVEGVLNNPNGRAKGMELDITNLTDTHYDLHPYHIAGSTIALWIACGGDITMNPGATRADGAIAIGTNGSTFDTGIVFQAGGLTFSGGSPSVAHAIRLPTNAMVEWHSSGDNALAAMIRGSIASSANASEIQFTDSGVQFNSGLGGGAYFSASRVAAAAARIDLLGAGAGGTPEVRALGSSTNIPMTLRPKGAGALAVINGNGQGLEVTAAASSVDWLRVAGAASGGRPTISAQGSDTNIDIALTPKGAGLVAFGTFTSGADAAVTGYVQIKTADGSIRKLATIA